MDGSFWFAAAAGLVVGSFLNVAIHRLPRGESLIAPRSRCPACSASIRWRDNVPIASWLWLGGRCRACSGRIPLRYPAVEVTLAAVCVSAPWSAGWGRAGVWIVFLGLLVALAATDLESLVLPDRLTLPGAAIGLAASVLPGDPEPLLAVFGAALGAGLLLLLRAAWLWFRRVEAVGLGDVKMLLFVGSFLGPAGVFAAVGIAALLGLLAAAPLLAAGRIRRTTPLPFGALLAAGAAAVFLLDPV